MKLSTQNQADETEFPIIEEIPKEEEKLNEIYKGESQEFVDYTVDFDDTELQEETENIAI